MKNPEFQDFFNFANVLYIKYRKLNNFEKSCFNK